MMVETRDFEEAARNNPPKAHMAFYTEKGERTGCWMQCWPRKLVPGSH